MSQRSYATIAELHDALRACRLCLEAGYQIEPGAVFSGSAAAEVMIIGQAPGITEGQVKRPFNAGSGTRLFQWLAEAGWDEDDFRARHYMAAVTRCYPGKGKGKGDRVPTRAEQKLCRPFLEQEIALLQPRLIIPVGGLAIKLFYPSKLRLDEIIGTAVYFPAQALANPVTFKIKKGRRVAAAEAAELDAETLRARFPRDGRWLVPLPHPSGASLWLNKPAHQALIARATRLLGVIREAWGL